MPYRRPDKLRQVAVLVASLDESLADALLSELPPAEAAQVRELVSKLDEIDPDEQADVLEQLRRSAQQPAPTYHDTVEIESTLADQIDRWSQSANPEPTSQDRFRQQIAAADAAAIASRLQSEHPQIIAVALLRLPEDKAEAVFEALPADIQPLVVERLTHSTPADEAAVSELEAHLSQWIAHDLQLESHRAAGNELVERLRGRLTAASATSNAVATATPAAADPPSDAPRRSAWSSLEALAWLKRQRAEATPAPPADTATPVAEAVRYDPADLERLDDQTLLAVLCEADPRQAQLALRAGSEQLLRRVVKQAPRRAARQLRRQLHNWGPVPLKELDEAQQALLRLAQQRGATVRTMSAAASNHPGLPATT